MVKKVRIPKGSHYITRDVPQDWQSVHRKPKHKLLIFKALLTDDVETAICAGFDISTPVYKAMDSMDAAALYGLLKPLLKASAVPIVERIDFQGVAYWMPLEAFNDGTGIQFALADSFLKQYLETQADSRLACLVATILRPKTTDLQLEIRSREQVEAESIALSKLPMEVSMMVLTYFLGVKQLVADWYGDYAFGDEETECLETMHFPKFGWWGLFNSIAETGVFGTYIQVLQTPLHRLMMHTVETRRKALEIKALSSVKT